MPNPVMQFQIVAKDPDAIGAFYTQLFGWTIDANNPMNYRRILTGVKEGIDGGLWPAPPQATNFVQIFVAVDDAEAYVKKAEALGAKLLFPIAKT